ncbi:hypothetical protein [Prolixibacter sp. NT017]|uniref:hypothetical protein n=1 Tax=Prolixibacter sp. NT017 TaxID=2652390 RepID=UPI00128115B0|nr:hypothetical protein [Prolixibacter sp. NT017]GET24364.1 hypothetical protein NT017_06930 [Prolixibacter sp. NT017]
MIQLKQNIAKLATQKESIIRAIRVAILVGIILNIINNPGIFSLSFEGMNIYRMLLTFVVPFCVSLYSSVLANRKNCTETIKSN